ncbi:MAG: class I SAM-dependent methyltransferase [Candidatus Omnitrophota bacterium]
MIEHLKKWLKLPEVDTITSLDDPRTTELHSRIIKNKPFLTKIYNENYLIFKKIIQQFPNGKFIELGSGGGFIKEINPKVFTSDVLDLKGIDLCFSAEAMPFGNNSVDAFLMIDVLHHIKNPRRILTEMDRCLKVNGRIVMIEPANTIWSRFVFQNFHHEQFDPASGWNIEGDGPMSDANGALPWIIFFRDRAKFQQEYPSLKIKSYQNHTPIRYLLSGGVSMRQLVPSCTYPLVKFLEVLISPLNSWVGMFCKIELQKTT